MTSNRIMSDFIMYTTIGGPLIYFKQFFKLPTCPQQLYANVDIYFFLLYIITSSGYTK